MAKIGDVGLGFGAGGVAPSTPTLSVSVSGTTATATINGDDGVTNWLYYAADSDTEWSTKSRAGDGTIEVADLVVGVRYTFVATSQITAGVFSEPSIPVDILIQATTTSVQNGLLSDEADTFLENFGEPVTYHPKGGSTRDIIAIIDRNPVASITGLPHGNTPRMLLIVKNSADGGISSSEVNTGGDKIALDVRIGQDDQQRRIMSVVWNDIGMMHLEVA